MATVPNGIAGHMRHGGMAARRLEGEVELARTRHHRSVMHDDLAGSHIRPIVQAENIADRKAFEKAGIEHQLGAAIALLGRLEDKIDRAPELTGEREIGGGAEEHGHMAVMAAGMHRARDLRAMGKAVVLGHGERVHVGAQGDTRSLPAARDDADHAIAADAGMDGNAHFGEALGDEGRGPGLFPRNLGMAMQIVPHRNQAGQGVFDNVGHRGQSSVKWKDRRSSPL